MQLGALLQAALVWWLEPQKRRGGSLCMREAMGLAPCHPVISFSGANGRIFFLDELTSLIPSYLDMNGSGSGFWHIPIVELRSLCNVTSPSILAKAKTRSHLQRSGILCQVWLEPTNTRMNTNTHTPKRLALKYVVHFFAAAFCFEGAEELLTCTLCEDVSWVPWRSWAHLTERIGWVVNCLLTTINIEDFWVPRFAKAAGIVWKTVECSADRARDRVNQDKMRNLLCKSWDLCEIAVLCAEGVDQYPEGR